jgi:hypothetical protein
LLYFVQESCVGNKHFRCLARSRRKTIHIRPGGQICTNPVLLCTLIIHTRMTLVLK